MSSFRLFSLLFLIILFSCGVKQPVENNDEQQQTGKIVVTSQPSGAAIILDGEPTGKITPDTLTGVSPGKHSISVYLDGYQSDQDQILVEVEANKTARVAFILTPIVTYATLQINSDPTGADIYLNGQNTGKQTPDTIHVTAGVQNITLIKNGFVVHDTSITAGSSQHFDIEVQLKIAQRVLLESFANVSCVPCVDAAHNLERFNSEHDASTFAIVEYFANWPNPNDPFYKVSPKDVDERVMYYGVQALPTLRMNGRTDVDAADYQAMEDAFNQLSAAQNINLALSIRKKLEGDSLKVSIEIYDRQGLISQNSGLKLYVLVSEDEIHFNNPPGSNGLKDFNFVFRKFLSARTGDEIASNVKTYSLKWPNWNYSQAHVIAFIQDVSSKKIYQTSIN